MKSVIMVIALITIVSIAEKCNQPNRQVEVKQNLETVCQNCGSVSESFKKLFPNPTNGEVECGPTDVTNSHECHTFRDHMWKTSSHDEMLNWAKQHPEKMQ